MDGVYLKVRENIENKLRTKPKSRTRMNHCLIYLEEICSYTHERMNERMHKDT